MRSAPTDDEVAALSDEFSDLLVEGRIERTDPLPPEVSGQDHLDLPRLALRFDPRRYGRLRILIDALNALPSAPADAGMPPTVADEERVVEREEAEDAGRPERARSG
jgi:hypothetical protein